MAKPDPLEVRAYRLVVKGAEKNAARALREIRQRVDAVEQDKSKDHVLALGEAQRLASSAAELVRYLSALHTLHEVEFLAGEEAAE